MKVAAPALLETAIILAGGGTLAAGRGRGGNSTSGSGSSRNGESLSGLPQGGGAAGRAAIADFILSRRVGLPTGEQKGGGGEYKGNDGPYEGNDGLDMKHGDGGTSLVPPVMQQHPPPSGSSSVVDAEPYAISQAEYNRRENVEVAALAHILGIPRIDVRAQEGLMALVLPGITGVGEAVSSRLSPSDWQNITDPQRPESFTSRDVEESDLFFRALPTDPLLRDAMGDAGAANDVVYTPSLFARALRRAGVDFARVQEARARIMAEYPPQRAQAIFRKWVVDRVVPSLATSGITYGAKELFNVLNDPNVVGGSREAEGGMQTPDDPQKGPSMVSGVNRRSRPPPTDKPEMTSGVNKREKSRLNEVTPPLPEMASGVNLREKTRKTILDKEIMDAANPVGATGGHSDHAIRPPRGIGRIPIQFMALDGSVDDTPDPDLPLGPADNIIPKSAPIYPPTFSPPTAPAGHGIFTDSMRGDSLSERANDPHAYIRRSTIPPPPSIVAIPSSQSYSPNIHGTPMFQSPTPPPPQQGFKRRAEMEPIHSQRHMENQIMQNYDPAFVPSMPSSVNANTSVHWQQYSGTNHGFTAPLDDAPNVVGIGYDAQTVEREFAQDMFKTPHQEISKESSQKAPSESATSTPADSPPSEPKKDDGVNAANATNPTYRNVERAVPIATKPGRSVRAVRTEPGQ